MHPGKDRQHNTDIFFSFLPSQRLNGDWTEITVTTDTHFAPNWVILYLTDGCCFIFIESWINWIQGTKAV